MSIDLEYPFVQSWLWEKPDNTVIMSMIIVDEKERGKGHCTKLVTTLKEKYKTIMVPTPSNALISILKKHGFGFEPNIGYWVWKKEK